MKRRTFLAHAGALAGSAALGQLGLLAANAAPANDYKALVCVFLYGGNDANNMIVPLDTAGYANYATTRSYLAIPQAQLLPLQVSTGAPLYGLHPALPGLQALWAADTMAIVANVGTLVQPLTKAQYLSTSTIKPESLFSHIDQQHQWQASISSTSSSNSGWGGRLTDQLATLNSGSTVPPMISTGGNNLFVTGAASQALVIPTSGSFGLNGYSSSATDTARLTALQQLLNVDQSDNLVQAAQAVMTGALASSAVLNPILTSTNATLTARFGALTGNFAAQLLAIAKVIQARSTLGASRQVFLVTLGSFDTHTNQLNTQESLFTELDAGLTAFHGAMSDIGTDSSVTSFTLSDFSRNFLPNTGGGTDHAWGSHPLVIGGAVKGGQIYGTMPTLTLSGPDDASDLGRWIPTIAVDQFAATLASWFGADATALAAVLPNLSAFSPANLGFI
ncbi:MAG TPA: DUF1501 domain-containing protein [Steroidobacteraceae bacterium]|jgi:uncharacterized protein (DUF1501 family)|nr:DUF1501 domain-containing protein [Steroidobacteraceae bacterium]